MNSDIETQIRQCETRLYAAMLGSDLAELETLIADDLLFAGVAGELATKEMDLELYRNGSICFHEFMPKDLEMRILNDSFVLVFAKIFLSGTFVGNAFSGDFRYTRIWRKNDLGWQIVGGSVSMMK